MPAVATALSEAAVYFDSSERIYLAEHAEGAEQKKEGNCRQTGREISQQRTEARSRLAH